MMTDKNRHKDKDVFRVPESYFEDFTENIMSRVQQRQDKSPGKILALVRPHLMLAVSMVFMVIISYTVLRLLLPEIGSRKQGIDSIELAEYLAYEVDQSSLFESLDQTFPDTYIDYDLDGKFNTEEIVDYLSDEELNFDELFENL